MLDELLSCRTKKLSSKTYVEPDYAYIHKELAKKGVPLTLLWEEYCERCRLDGKIPYMSTQFGDVVLSMNGLHVFPDKNAAFSELFRVLKPGGLFCGCTYIMGESKKTDWFINKFYVTGGYFNPPFDTRESLRSRLNKMYSSVNVETLLSEACFSCIK